MEKILENKKIIIIAAIILVAGLLSFIIYKKSTKLTKIEEIKIKEVSDDVVDYLEELENDYGFESEKIERHVAFALAYASNEKGQGVLSNDDVLNILEDKITKKYTKEDLEQVTTTPYFIEKNIVHDPSYGFTMDLTNRTYRDIANTNIIKYIRKDIKKGKKNTYIVTYDKYVITNPYEILNYYNDLDNEIYNSLNQITEDGEIITIESDYERTNTEDIRDYLSGESNLKTIKKYITEEVLKAKGKSLGTVKVTYKLVDDKVLIDSIDSDAEHVKIKNED